MMYLLVFVIGFLLTPATREGMLWLMLLGFLVVVGPYLGPTKAQRQTAMLITAGAIHLPLASKYEE